MRNPLLGSIERGRVGQQFTSGEDEMEIPEIGKMVDERNEHASGKRNTS